MLTTAAARTVLGLTFPLFASLLPGQSRATCAYSEQFPQGGLPAGWIGLPAQVERLDSQGNGTGEFVAPWQVGNAVQANAGGYFPVPDEPQGNTFVMANDDASPCDCAMDDLSLFSPFYDLSGMAAPALSYRVYHDGRPFNGQASLEASPDGNVWTQLETIPAVLGAWQYRTVDLGGFASGPIQLRFRYDDGGNWSSGIAVDDICIFPRLQNDIALNGAWLGDISSSPFNTGSRSLGYSRLPLEQQTPLRLSALVRNNGLETATALRVQATITWDGGTEVITNTVCDTLEPLADTLVSWETGFLADQAGIVSITLLAEAFNPDEGSSDNGAALEFAITSPDEGNNAMALDNDLGSTVVGTDAGFSTGCRFELAGGTSTVHGISVRFGEGTLPGSRVHTLLMDANFNLLSSSASHTISDEDLTLSFAGGSVYIPLDSLVSITNTQDVIALVRCLPDSGALRVTAGGAVPEGAAFLVDAGTSLISFPGTAPIVRLHLSDAVTAISEDRPGQDHLMSISPNPAKGLANVKLPSSVTGPVRLDVLGPQGQVLFRKMLTNSPSGLALDLSGWPAGMYLVRVTGADLVASGRMVVE